MARSNDSKSTEDATTASSEKAKGQPVAKAPDGSAYIFNKRSWYVIPLSLDNDEQTLLTVVQRWRRVPFTSSKPPPPPIYSIADSPLTPEATANIFNLITFGWISSLLTLGYSRPLVAGDLYRLQDDRSSASIANKINESFDRRKREAEEFNARLAKGEVSPGIHRFWWSDERKKRWREKDGKKKASLVLAMNDSVKWWFWTGGFVKVVGDTAQVTSPLVVKVRSSLQPATLIQISIPRLSSTLLLSLMLGIDQGHETLRQLARGLDWLSASSYCKS
jgi:hypothetical protein